MLLTLAHSVGFLHTHGEAIALALALVVGLLAAGLHKTRR